MLVALCQPLHTPGDLVDQIASRQELVTNRGTARRLAGMCNQIDVTWDLYALEPDELLTKLPKEFQRFQPVA